MRANKHLRGLHKRTINNNNLCAMFNPSLTDYSLFKSIVGMDDHKLLQQSNLTVQQTCKATNMPYI